MTRAFDGADWAVREPKVLRGTTVTGDNYWKGQYGHANALLMTQTYGCPDPYATTEMEDIAIARTAKQLGMLDRLIILRDSVNMDTFMLGATPESLWDPEHDNSDVSNENSEEYIDIFATARENNFIVGRTIIDAILEGEF
jgi:purine nucleoside permease